MSISRIISTPITSAVFVDRFLFIGQGSRLQIFAISNGKSELEISYQAFQSCNIHGIKPDRLNCHDGQLKVKVCLTAGRIFCIVHFDTSNAISRIEPISSVIKIQDWIWDVQWLNDDSDNLAILTAQNYVILWNYKDKRQVQVKTCQESCILYSGIFVGNVWNDITVLSGTVFSEILVWNPRSELVSHRLKGHNGVIFSINYNAKLRKLCSGSDDRSIQIWQHLLQDGSLTPATTNECLTVSQWKTSSFVLLCKLYGHEARIWKVVCMKQSFVSVGEDSLLCFWKYDDKKNCGKMYKKILMHNGSSIWSVAINEAENLIATGGGNGGLKLWKVGQQHKCEADKLQIDIQLDPLIVQKESASEPDYPRLVTFLNECNLLIISNNGIIFVYSLSDNKLKRWFNYNKFKSYCVADVNRSLAKRCLVAIGDLNGEVTILETETFSDQPRLTCEQRLYDRGCWRPYGHKVLALKWLDSSTLLTCGPHGSLFVFAIGIEEGKVKFALLDKFELPACKQRWFSAAAILKSSAHDFLFCGCPRGGLFLYEMGTDGNSIVPIQSFPKIHGTHGVTHIHVVNENSVQTTGRDGFLRLFELRTNSIHELNKIWVAGCSKWISGLVSRSNDLLIYGFHSDNFVVWSEQHEMIILEIPCGGGHRSWDFFLEDHLAIYAYIKDRQITVHLTQLEHHMPITVKPGFHTKEICDIHFLFSASDVAYFATASEDTTIKILGFKDDVKVTTTLKNHISSVRAIGSCSLAKTADDILLVTCGGRAQIVVWNIGAGNARIRVEQLASHMLLSENRRPKKPWLQTAYVQDPETRYMDVCVWFVDQDFYMIALACSDSYLRLFGFNIRSRTLKLLMEDCHHGHCLLKIEHVNVCKHSVVITAATDGKAVMWDVTVIEQAFMLCSLSEEPRDDDDEDCDSQGQHEHRTCTEQKNYQIIHEIQLHQSGITALAVDILERNEAHSTTTLDLITGGDDTGLKLTKLQLEDNSGCVIANEIDRAIVKLAHSAPITEILTLTDGFIITVSVDRRMCVWKLQTASNEGQAHTLELELVECIFSSVADISSATILRNRNKDYSIAVAGIGLETVEINTDRKVVFVSKDRERVKEIQRF